MGTLGPPSLPPCPAQTSPVKTPILIHLIPKPHPPTPQRPQNSLRNGFLLFFFRLLSCSSLALISSSLVLISSSLTRLSSSILCAFFEFCNVNTATSTPKIPTISAMMATMPDVEVHQQLGSEEMVQPFDEEEEVVEEALGAGAE